MSTRAFYTPLLHGGGQICPTFLFIHKNGNKIDFLVLSSHRIFNWSFVLNIHAAEITLGQGHGQRTPQMRLISFTDPVTWYTRFGLAESQFWWYLHENWKLCSLDHHEWNMFRFSKIFDFCRFFFRSSKIILFEST